MSDILLTLIIGVVGVTISAIWACKSAEKEADKVAKEVVRECWEEWLKAKNHKEPEI